MVLDISKTLYSTVFYVYLLIGAISMGTAVLYNAKPNSFPEQKLRKKIIDSMIVGMIIIIVTFVFDVIISGFDKFIAGQGIYPIITSFSFVFTMFFWKSLNPHDYKLGDVIEEKPEVKPEEEMTFKLEVLKGTKKEKEKESENFKEVTLTETLMQQSNEKDEKLSTIKKINLEKPKTEEEQIVEVMKPKEEHSEPIKEVEFDEIEKATKEEEKRETQKTVAPQEILPPKLEIANERKKLPDTIIVEPQESINKLKNKHEIEEEQKPPWVKDLNEIKQAEPQKIEPEKPKEETPKKPEKKKDDFDDIINNLRK